jgi:hypothetical protein
MNHYDKALIQYWLQQGATMEQIRHILGNQTTWK